MAKMQEHMNQRANAGNPSVPPMVETPTPPPQVDPPVPIGAPGGVSHVNFHPPVVEIEDQHDSFFRPNVVSQYDAFGPITNEVEMKVKAIKEKLKAIESINALGLDATKMFLVLGVVISSKSKVPDFEKYNRNSDPMTHIRAYCQKISAYSSDNRCLMHFFQDSLSGAFLD